MYNVVLIGCGHMGAVHLDDIYMKENVNVYGVVDVDIQRAQQFAKRYGADSFDTDYMRYMKDDHHLCHLSRDAPGDPEKMH